jgi:uncharacterized protein YyaL (SSP411 family)
MSARTNRLAGQSSPYLLQHAHNPVDWRPWGEEAFAEARARDCPVLLSIGYAACHWCHVMAHESFENEETARAMNAAFVNIKVDREERPDVDHHYMTALHTLGQQGGWPLTMFLTPEGKPFFGGTYWPPVPRWGRPSFPQIIAGVENAWKTKRADMLSNGEAIESHLAELAAPRSGGDLAAEQLTKASLGLLRILDPINGGVGSAPKFPNAPIFNFLHSEIFRNGDPRLRKAVRQLLDALCAGGIYDHLGGGFARYSTDAEWHVPHFEKMLYDNAQILELLALAHADSPSPTYVARARETFDWLMREMRVGDAFAASLDADQDGEEGLFYVWTEAEIDAALGAGAAEFKAVYDVRAGGNWEGSNVLRRLKPLGDGAFEARLAAARAKLFEIRSGRAAPPRDDKILADWNGMMIAALARASAVFAEPEFLAAARSAFAAVWNGLRNGDDRLVHSAREGRIGAPAMLDDYAALARAALALFQATGAPGYLHAATAAAEEAQALFGAEDGGLYLTAIDAADAPSVRARISHDGATPSGVGLMADVYATLHHLTLEPRWETAGAALIRAFSGASEQELPQSPLLLAACDKFARGGCVLVCGPLDDPAAQALAKVALCCPDPAIVTFRYDPALWPQGAPGGRPAPPEGAMLCRGMTCGLPQTEPDALRAALLEGA